MPTIIGDAYVGIHAKDRGFEREVRRIVDGLDDIFVGIRADDSGFRKDMERIVNDIDDVVVSVTADTDEFVREVNSLADDVADVTVDVYADTTGFFYDVDSIAQDAGDAYIRVHGIEDGYFSDIDDIVALTGEVSIGVHAHDAGFYDDVASIVQDAGFATIGIHGEEDGFFEDVDETVALAGDVSVGIHGHDAGFTDTLLDLLSQAEDLRATINIDADVDMDSVNDLSDRIGGILLKTRLDTSGAKLDFAQLRDFIVKKPVTIDAKLSDKAQAQFSNFIKRNNGKRTISVNAKVNPASEKAFRNSLQGFAPEIKIKASVDVDSIENSIQMVQDALRDTEFEIPVTVKESTRRAFADMRETATIMAVANTAAAEAQLARASRDRVSNLYLNANNRLNSQTLQRFSNWVRDHTNNMIDPSGSPLVRMFDGPEINEAMRKFTVSMAGVIDPKAVRDSIVQLMSGFDDIAVNAAKLTTMVGGIATSIVAASGAAVTLARDLGKATGLIAMAPAALTFGISALKTWGTLWTGIGTAMSYDTETAMKAIEKMPPAMQEAATLLHAFSKELQTDLAEAYWGKMTDGIGQFVDVVSGPLRDGLVGMADAMADISLSVVDVLSQFAQMGKLTNTYNNFNLALQNSEGLISNLVYSFLEFTNAGSKYLPQFTAWMTELSDEFVRFTDTSIQTGQFDAWVLNAVDTLKELVSIGSSVGTVFATIGKAASAAGSYGLADFSESLEGIANWIKDPTVFLAITNFFRSANTGFETMADGFFKVLGALGRESHVFAGIMGTTADTIGMLFEHLATAITDSGALDGFNAFVDGVNEGVAAMGPGIKDFGDIFGMLAEMMGETLAFMGPGFTILADLLKDVLDPIYEGFMAIHGPMNEAFQLLTAIIKGPLVALSTIVGGLLKTLAQIPTPIMALATGLAMLVGPLGALKVAWAAFTGTKFVPPRLEPFKRGLDNISVGLDNVKSKISNLTTGRTVKVMDLPSSGVREVDQGVNNLGRSLSSLPGGKKIMDVRSSGLVDISSELNKIENTHVPRVQSALGKLGQGVKNIMGGVVGAIFNPVNIGFAAIAGAITLWQGVQEGVKQATAFTENFSEAWDPVTGKVRDAAAQVDVLTSRFDEMKVGRVFGNFSDTLKDAGIDAKGLAERLSEIDSVSLDNIGANIDNVREAFSKDFGADRVKNAVAAMSDELVAMTGKTREELASLNAVEFNQLMAGLDETVDGMGRGRDAAKSLRDSLNEITSEVGGQLWDYAESDRASQGLRDALGRANEQAKVLDSNFQTISSTTSTVADKLAAMQSNMDLLQLDTSAWNDPMERLWQTAQKNTDEFGKLKDTMNELDIDPTGIISIEEAFGGAQHAAFNFSGETAKVSSQLNSVMKESSGAIKESFIESFDKARESGATMAEATNAALGSIQGSSDQLRASLSDMGIPDAQIDALFDTFGILSEDLEKSIVIDEESKQQAKRDLIEIEVAAQAFASGDYSGYLRFITDDAESRMSQFLQGAKDAGEIESRLNLDSNQAKDLLDGLVNAEYPVDAVMSMDTIDAQRKIEILKGEKIALEGKLKVPGLSDEERGALQAELKATEAGLDALGVKTEVKTDEIRSSAEAFLGSYSPPKVQVGADAQSIPAETMAKVQEAMAAASPEARVKFQARMEELGYEVPAAVGEAARTAEANANVRFGSDTSQITPEAKAGADSAVAMLNPMLRMGVDSMGLSGSAQEATSAAVASANATNPAVRVGAEGSLFMQSLSGFTEAARLAPAKVSVSGDVSDPTAKMNTLLSTYGNSIINVTTNADTSKVHELAGAINIIPKNTSLAFNANTGQAIGGAEAVRSAVSNIPDKNVQVSAAIAEAMRNIGAVEGNNIDDKAFDIITSNAVAQGLINETDVNDIKNKVFDILTNNGDANRQINSTDANNIDHKLFDILTNNGDANRQINSTDANNISHKDFDITANDRASGVIGDIRSASIPEKVVNIVANVSSKVQSFFGFGNLNGGIVSGKGVKTFADGGIEKAIKSIQMSKFAKGSENHVAQIAKGGWPYRVWAEPETGGEAYIPLAKSKRKRSTDILEQVARTFGYSLVKKFANGGIMKASAVKAPKVQTFANGGISFSDRVWETFNNLYYGGQAGSGLQDARAALKAKQAADKAQRDRDLASQRAMHERLRTEERARNERLRDEERARQKRQLKDAKGRQEQQRIAERARNDSQRKAEQARHEAQRKAERDRIYRQVKDQRAREKALRASQKAQQDRIKAEQKAQREKEKRERDAARTAQRAADQRKKDLARKAKQGNQEAQRKLDDLKSREESFRSAIDSGFKGFSDALAPFMIDKEDSPVTKAVKDMDNALRLAIKENGSVNPELAYRAKQVRKTLAPHDNLTSIWKGGVDAGLKALDDGIRADGTMRKSFTLRDLEAGLERTGTRIEDAKRELESFQSAWDGIFDSITKTAREPFSLENTLTLAQETNKPISAEMLNKSAKAVIQRNIEFSGVLRKMSDKGFPPALINEIGQLGAGQGILVAEELLRTATPKEIAELSKNYAMLESSSALVGKTVADSMYGAGLEAANGVYNGLVAREEKLKNAALILSNALVSSFKDALQIKSPSRVMKNLIGAHIPTGIAAGMVEGIPSIDAARDRMHKAITLPPKAKGYGIQNHRAAMNNAAIGGQNSAPVVQYNIVTNNPLPETRSETMRKNNKNLSLMGL